MNKKGFLQVKNWESFQHYKDRNPPWIKLSTDIFQDYEFSCLHDASKLLAVCVWTLASRYKDPKLGLIPYDFEYIKRQGNFGNFVQEEHLRELIDCGFLTIASNTLASCKQNAIPETETETETETEKKQAKKKNENAIEQDFEKFWNSYGYSKSKPKAMQAYERARKSGASHEEIQAGVEAYKKARGNDKQYWKHPATWLNGQAWNDEYTSKDKSRHDLSEKNYDEPLEGFVNY